MNPKILPDINIPINAKCKNAKNEIVYCQIKRIKALELNSKWQWSNIYFNSYFTLKVISWKYIHQLKIEF